MKLAALAARDHAAQVRMVEAAEKLAERFGIEAGLRIRPSGTRAPRVAAMHQREALADFLEALVDAGVGKRGFTLEELELVPGIGKATLGRIAEAMGPGPDRWR